MTADRATHTADSCRWYTPPDIVEPARDLLGGIDLDPASDEAANRIVRASTIYTIDNDGLAPENPWARIVAGTRVWLNPPTPPRRWWQRFEDEVERGVYLAYSIEQLQQSQLWTVGGMPAHRLCIPDRRIRFLRRADDAVAAYGKLAEKRPLKATELREVERLRELPGDTLVAGDAPAHASALVGIGVPAAEWRQRYGWLGWCS
jgi:hypothetical protein